MCDDLVWSFDAITAINWLEVFKALAEVGTAIIAFLALRNWRWQDKAKREAEFLDALIEATHAYIAEMSKPIMLLRFGKFGMASEVQAWGDEEDKAVKGAIVYIQKNGENDAKRLLDTLEAVQPSTIKLRSLASKGQVFKFDNYEKLQNAVASLTSQFDRMEAFTTVMGSPTWNWENRIVLQTLQSIMAIDPEEMRKSVEDGNVAVLEFTSETYKRIYGSNASRLSIRYLRQISRRGLQSLGFLRH